MRPLRIAHISDLHHSPSHRRINIRHTKKLLDYIARQSVDHVVVTGDISADAKVTDFALARQLFASWGMLDSSRLSVFPGKNAYLQFNIIEIQGSTCSVMTHRLSPDTNLALRSEKRLLFLPQYSHRNAGLRRTA